METVFFNCRVAYCVKANAAAIIQSSFGNYSADAKYD